ncbi:MAG: outer membrane protein [Methylocella sp.]
MLRRTLLASAGAMALTGAAFAADLRAPPPVFLPPPPIYTWTGLYAGINAGYTWGNNSVTTTSGPETINFGAISPLGVAHATAAAAGADSVISTNNSGFIGGGQIGYNFQFYNSWVVGIEADIQGSTSRGSGQVFNVTTGAGFPAFPDQTSISAADHLDYLGTVRGRLGFTITPTLLVYGTGGLAYGGLSSSTSISGAEVPASGPNNGFWVSNGSISNSHVGWTAGGGLEWMFMPNWSAKVEYLYYDLSSLTYSAGTLSQTFPGGVPFWSFSPSASTHFRGNIVRAGLNYHFNLLPPPIVAKY